MLKLAFITIEPLLEPILTLLPSVMQRGVSVTPIASLQIGRRVVLALPPSFSPKANAGVQGRQAGPYLDRRSTRGFA